MAALYLKWMDYKNKSRSDANSAMSQERMHFIDTMRKRIDEGESEYGKLWQSFRAMQQFLAECEKLHREDEAKINAAGRELAILKSDNESLRLRVAALEARASPQV